MTEFIPGGPTRFAHQKRGLAKMIKTGGVTALLFDPGLGKTATALDYISLLALKAQPDARGAREARVLVVCPLAAVDTWVLQCEEYVSPQVNYWAEAIGGGLLQRAEAIAARGNNPFRVPLTQDGPRAKKTHPRARHVHYSWAWAAKRRDRDVEITRSEGPDGLGIDMPRVVLCVTNLDTLVSRAAVGSQTMADVMVEAIKRYSPDLVIVDESHKIKSAQGNASRLMGRVAKFVKRRVILTGTVLPHSPLDIFGQWRFLNPYAFGSVDSGGIAKAATFSGFRNRFAIMGGYMGHEVTGYRNLDELQQIMSQNAVVARKEDSLDLPPVMDVVVPVNLSPKEKQAYADMRDKLAAQLSPGVDVTVPNRLSQMMRLRQITAGYVPDDNGIEHVIGQSKVATIHSLVHDSLVEEKRIVVFALFTREIDMLKAALSKKGTEVMTIDGSTNQADRQAMRKRFGSNDPARIVMIAQVKTMSLAVNELVTASHAIFATLSQQRDDIVQARDRLNRIGQTKPCTFWFALAPGTVDDVVYRSYVDRTNLETAMLKHVHNNGEKAK